MEGKSLYDFYENFLLPQFGLKNIKIEWSGSDNVGPDESVHYFSVGSDEYALIFEDYAGLGNAKDWVKENVRLKDRDFEYINPTSYSDQPPSYSVRFSAPYQHCTNITGTFTLVKL